ncbi:hypothetical protein PIB30_075239 [Stylosanthes scabra]|uniref:ABC1 atypical kinase-like domain-containing protein n=1 Tax=Stylosanthes scabra TaxID=79078 RepID=A0ABU6TS43_9FABA|nr:hypothetical protein [Stylosanthes scabra]
MSRFVVCENVRRLARSSGQKHKIHFFDVFNLEPYHPRYSAYSMYQFFSSHSRLVHKGQTPLMYVFKLKYNNTNVIRKWRNIYNPPTNSANGHHPHVVWNKISQMCFHYRPTPPPIGQIARAVSFALARSNILIPGFIAFAIGELAWTQQSCAEAESFPNRDSFYMHALDGRIYLTSVILEALEIVILFIRAIYLIVLFFPCIAMAPLVNHFGDQFRKTWIHVVRLTLEKAGPAFIKWGQWAATRPDLFPRDLCGELSEFHTKAPSHKFTYSRACIENAFGRKLSEIFENFDEEPVASGSIAQVHRATLKYKYPGQQMKPLVVAVKVRHPGVADAIRRDFVIINLMAKISCLFPNLKWLRLDESVQQFAVYMMSQVDLSREAAHLSRFIYNFRRWKDVSFPMPLYPLVHPSVLVETYEQGESVLHYVDDLEGQEHIKSALAHIGTHALLKMLLVDNFIHADMHPGNILVRVAKSKLSPIGLFKSRPHVIFLDVGLTTELSKMERENLLKFFQAVALQDGRSTAESTLRLSKRQNCPDPISFTEEVEKSFDFWRSTEGERVSTADRIQQLLEHVRCHKVNLDGNVCAVMVTTLVLETLLFKKEDWAESMSHAIEGVVAP